MPEKIKHEAHTFFVDTRFQRMARRPGGVLREQAIEHAQANIDELKPEFADWLDRELQELSAAISQIEGNSSDTLQLDRAYHSCCQLRDVGATMGFELVTFIANNLCEILGAIKAGAAYDKDMIDCHIDALFLARKDPYRNLRPDQLPEMIGGLRRVVELASIIPARTIK